uniref:Methyltransferase 8, methylcytidine n=1 Tax=Fundulus heteroclitus TaxID=8078 RepID=A0A3Q2TL06_FUNHE
MHKQWSISVLKQASAFIRFSVRLKSTNARPAAPLGSRILTNPEDVFKHNMWDHVQWTEEDQEAARQKAEENSSIRLPSTEQGYKFDTDAFQYWDQFYEVHQDKFFKDRRWLFLEFPELLPSSAEKRRTNACLSHQVAADSHRRKTDTFFPQETEVEPNETVTRTSFFPGGHASFRILEVGCGVGNSVFPIVNTIKNTDSFLYCCDFSPRAIQLVKVSINSMKKLNIVRCVISSLKLYGDVYFNQDQLMFQKIQPYLVHDLFSKAGLEEIQNLEDKRLQVNRGKKVVMRRVWMQSKYRKPS